MTMNGPKSQFRGSRSIRPLIAEHLMRRYGRCGIAAVRIEDQVSRKRTEYRHDAAGSYVSLTGRLGRAQWGGAMGVRAH
jgi:hypothetical protein